MGTDLDSVGLASVCPSPPFLCLLRLAQLRKFVSEVDCGRPRRGIVITKDAATPGERVVV